jgi:hypothetical protein
MSQNPLWVEWVRDYGSPPAPGRTLEISHFTRPKRDVRLI